MRGLVLVLAAAAAGCAVGRTAPVVDPAPRQAVIADLQAFGEDLGVERTGNFQRFSDDREAVYRCYYTGVLELPRSYEALQLLEADEPACPIDEAAYDVFFYPIEAVASGSSPVSPALVEAPLERALMVVPHEDFHNQAAAAMAPFEIAEPAATLIGFLAARDYARSRYGETSDIFLRLDHEAERFLEKARRINAYFDRLEAVYADYDAGRLARDAALARKATIYAALRQECTTADRAVSFNTCPAAMNNAGLAFDRTYARLYPAWFEIYDALGRDTRATVAAFKQLLATSPQSADDLLDARRILIPQVSD